MEIDKQRLRNGDVNNNNYEIVTSTRISIASCECPIIVYAVIDTVKPECCHDIIAARTVTNFSPILRMRY